MQGMDILVQKHPPLCMRMCTREGCSLGLHMFPLYVEPTAIRARAAN